MERIKTAIIGFGTIGKRYFAILQSMPQFLVVGIVDTVEIAVDGVHCYASIELLCSHNKDLQLVIVCTPNAYHTLHTVNALEHRCAVVCEKPLALTVNDARRSIDAAQLYQQSLFCVMQNRFSPAVQWLKQLVAEGALGQIRMLQVNCLWNRSDDYYRQSSWRGTRQLDGGVLFTQFSHFIDLIIWLFGPMCIKYASLSNFAHQLSTEIDDTGTVFFTVGEGSSGVLSFTTAVPHKNFDSSMTIIGSNGCIVLGGQYMDTIERCTVPNLALPVFNATMENHQHLLVAVFDTLSIGKSFPIAPNDALLVVETIEEIYKMAVAT